MQTWNLKKRFKKIRNKYPQDLKPINVSSIVSRACKISSSCFENSYVSTTKYLNSSNQKQWSYHVFTSCEVKKTGLFSIQLYKLKFINQQVNNTLCTQTARRARRGREVKTLGTPWVLGGSLVRAQLIAKYIFVETQELRRNASVALTSSLKKNSNKIVHFLNFSCDHGDSRNFTTLWEHNLVWQDLLCDGVLSDSATLVI